jgi:aldehyde dehydrogenase (NAD+)
MSKPLLEALGLTEVNAGACTGPDGWIAEPDAHKLTSFNPATGEPIATVALASPAAYDRVVLAARAAFLTWRETPAPKRGDVVRDLGQALRDHKEPLGDCRPRARSSGRKGYMRRQTNTVNWSDALPLAQGITFGE